MNALMGCSVAMGSRWGGWKNNQENHGCPHVFEDIVNGLLVKPRIGTTVDLCMCLL